MVYSTIFFNDLFYFLPEAFLTFCLFYLLVFSSIKSTQFVIFYGNPVILNGIIWTSALALAFSSSLVYNGQGCCACLVYGGLFFDFMGLYGKVIIYLAAALCLVLSRRYLVLEGILVFEFPLLILLSVLGMVLLLESYNFLSVYLALELQSLALYVLSSFSRGSAYSTEAGLKYFVIGAFSSGLFLFGVSLIYAFTGSCSFEDFSRLFTGVGFYENIGVFGGLLFVSAGLLFKLGAAPFHMWLPDIYEGSPTISGLFFSVVPKLSIFIVLVRIYYSGFYDFIVFWQGLLIFFSSSSMLFALLGAFYQRKVKRFLAFSSIGHVGFMLIGLSSGTLEGLQALFIYIIVYMIMMLIAWSVLISTQRENLTSLQKGPFKYLDEFPNLFKINPTLGFSFVILMFSMAGVPPFAGFSSKLFLFFSAMESSLFLLSFLGVLVSVVSSFYYLRLIKIMCFDKNIKKFFKSSFFYDIVISKEISLVLSVSNFFILFFFFKPNCLLFWTHLMALSVFFLIYTYKVNVYPSQLSNPG